ncbi:NAD(P)/FAD-dependent oxidoreductase [Dyadobacter subterraneus]|uniref:NADH:ubiquinone reductase (non-electrogenic) n=1 Tax=Dyadobacter subterraneus TaxID=2773304 RepID=A0ABR9W7A4_9BACT|nr:NAD(P)/FAD-dependent oxidoreductase [Dyadobacter subterraneus]MBE9461335.1 NAD(P)/FAD-dependent oxidoreductase [Dyadobacter subterraneus]
METVNAFKKRIVIIGGGFAGLNLVRQLYNNNFYHVTLVDKNNYNYFTPLLYQVATSFLEPSSISYPFRKLFKGRDIAFRMATVLHVDTEDNILHLTDGSELEYDYLIFAAGSKTNFFGNESIQRNAFSLKGIDDALFIRNELIKTLEKASLEKDPVEKQKLLTIVIAGGGPTGVEVAGMLAEMKRYILGMDYPELKMDEAQIYVIDGAPYLLAPMSDKTHNAAYEALTSMDVHIKLKTQVTLFENDKVHLSNGEIIEAKTLLWAAGVIAHTFEGINETSLGRGKRMITDAYNLVQGYHNVYAIGDISIQFTDDVYPAGHPQLAQPAIQQGKRLAKNLLAMAQGKPLKPFKYFDRGDMAIIGRRYAYADLFKHKFHLGGLPGLLGWLFIHLISLVNYDNMLRTLYSWAISYLTCDQSLRMIFRSENRENREAIISEPVEEHKFTA